MSRQNKMVYLAVVAWVLVWAGTDGCARRSGMVEQGAGVGQTASSGQRDDVQASLGADQPMASDVARGTDTLVVGLTDVFFEFDNALLSPEARRSLDLAAQWLRASSNRRVVIEGHADERGTNEYNLALAERRAQAAKRYLVASGIEERRLRVVSYGEERPFCREREERCWRENRRGHFVADAD
jgi:peptidoglycan-associated lipoprotein